MNSLQNKTGVSGSNPERPTSFLVTLILYPMSDFTFRQVLLSSAKS
jgi:hypothetical protein